MWSALFEHCRARGGPVQIRAASAATGVPASAIRSRARREGWWQPHRDVAAPPGTPVDGRRWGLAALARCTGPDPDAPRPVALARWSGLAALGIRQTWPTAAQVVVPTTRAPRPGRRLAVVRWGGFDVGRDAEQVDGLRVLRPPALVRSLAPVADVDVLIEVLIDLVQKRLVTLDQIADDLVEHPLTPGRCRIEQALARLGAAGRTDSPPELQLRERLTAAGIPLDGLRRLRRPGARGDRGAVAAAPRGPVASPDGPGRVTASAPPTRVVQRTPGVAGPPRCSTVLGRRGGAANPGVAGHLRCTALGCPEVRRGPRRSGGLVVVRGASGGGTQKSMPPMPWS
jgi:hypothetical protein